MSKRRMTASKTAQQGSSRRLKSRTVSSIRLSGKWLKEGGFKAGDRFVVEELPGCVVLRAESAAKEER